MRAATKQTDTFDILQPVTQMSASALGCTEAPNDNTHPLPHRGCLGIPGFPVHLFSLPLLCSPTLSSQSHVPRAKHSFPPPNRGPHEPLQLTIPPPSPPPAGHPLLSGPSPAQLSTRNLEPRDALAKNQAKKAKERGWGLHSGPLERLLCNKGSSRELESP